MTLQRRGPRQVSTPLAGLREQWAPESVLAEVQQLWAAVVGDRIAAAARPVSERDGLLTVVCSESVWAQELDLLADSIRMRLNERLERGSITRIRCRIGS